MRIISNFHDYYDSVERSSQDRHPVYIRKTQLIDHKPVSPTRMWVGNMVLSCFLIGFCGRIIPVVMDYRGGKWVSLYSYDETIEHIKNHIPAKDFARHESYRWSMFKDIKAFFLQNYNNLIPLFDKYKQPVFCIGEERGCGIKLSLNCELKRFSFYTQVDTFSAFQEIERFLQNMAFPEKPMPVISDEMKIHTHGFDKFSFRREKQHK